MVNGLGGVGWVVLCGCGGWLLVMLWCIVYFVCFVVWSFYDVVVLMLFECGVGVMIVVVMLVWGLGLCDVLC